MPPDGDGSTVAVHVVNTALGAVKRGWQPIPIREKAKMPGTSGWTRLRWDRSPEGQDEVREKFAGWAEEGFTNIGVLLGEPSGNLVDVDLDHPRTARLKRYFLPPTAMITGRAGRPGSHYWYICKEGTLPGNRRHKMPDGEMAVELRSTGSQTLLPPSVHPSGESYTWDSMDWGEPSTVDGHVLAVQVALLGLGTVLIDRWPEEGSRHEAYLALAGGVLRNTDGGVHPYWEKNLPVLIAALADATNDNDGADSRVSEVMNSTLKRIRSGDLIQGFGKLGEILGADAVKQVRVLMREVESSAGYSPRESVTVSSTSSDGGSVTDRADHLRDEVGGLDPEERDPLSERIVTWQPVDLEPYLSGNVKMADPEVLTREDYKSLMYRGRVNMLFGSSESAKSWIALYTCLQEMGQGERVMYLDFEDEPISTIDRLQRLGAGADDIRTQFNYIRPEEPLAPMQRNRWGAVTETDKGRESFEMFESALDRVDPSVIVADGMTVLYGLHGLDGNDATSTDIITGWLKTLTRNGRSTVIIIDHTSKGGRKGGMPIGSQHKTAMVQGSLLQVWPIRQPMRGRVGEVELVVVKDRPGRVREISMEPTDDERQSQVAAVVIMDSTEEGKTEMEIKVPFKRTAKGTADFTNSEAAERAVKARAWEEKIKHVYEGELGRSLSIPQIIGTLNEPGAEPDIRAAVARLEDQGWLEKIGKTKGQKYTLVIGVDGYKKDEN